jgi:hypothetical protein
MLKMQRSSNGAAVFTLSGHIDESEIASWRDSFRSEAKGRSIVLDLNDLTLVTSFAGAWPRWCATAISWAQPNQTGGRRLRFAFSSGDSAWLLGKYLYRARVSSV